VVRARQASADLCPSREPHWLVWSRPLDLARADSLTVITSSRICDLVLCRTIMRKVVGEWQEASPGLSGTIRLSVFSEGGW